MVDKDTWYPIWHVIQVQYRTPDHPLSSLGYIGRPFIFPSYVWYCKVAPHHEWCLSTSYDDAIRDLLRFHGLPTTDGSTIPLPHHWRDEWVDEPMELGDNGSILTREIIMNLRKPSFVDRWILDGPIGSFLALLFTLRCILCGVPKDDLEHE